MATISPEIAAFLADYEKRNSAPPAALFASPKAPEGYGLPELKAAQESDLAATQEAKRQAAIQAGVQMLVSRRFAPTAQVGPVDDNVKRWLMQRQIAGSEQQSPLAALQGMQSFREKEAGIGKTVAETGKVGAETGKTVAETPGAGAESFGKVQMQQKLAPEHLAFLVKSGVPVGPDTTYAQAKELTDQFKTGQGVQVDWAKLMLEREKMGQEKGKTAADRTADRRKEFQGNQVYKDAQQIAASYEKIKGATPTSAGDIALVYGFMKLLDPGSAVREGEYATAANAGGAFQKLGNIYNAVLKGEKLPQKVRDSLKAEANGTYQAQMKRYEALAEPYRQLAAKEGLSPEDVVLPFGSPEITSTPAASDVPRPTRTVNGETREWDGKSWVPVGR